MPPRESDLQKEWRTNVLEQLEDCSKRIHRQELEMAVFKAKWGIAMALIGFTTSIFGSAVIRYFFR